MKAYDYRNCQSLFGYAEPVHQRSGGVCQLCDAGAGAGALDFDLWRQLTVEHLIGESQGGYRPSIAEAINRRFSETMSKAEVAGLTAEIDAVNTVTACGFCNSTTSRDVPELSMAELIESAPAGPADQVLGHVRGTLEGILERKRSDVRRKLDAVRAAFDTRVAPVLEETRAQEALTPVPGPSSVADADVNLILERIISDLVPAADALVTPPGYAHLPLALIDAVYSIRSRYPTVKRVVAAYCAATETACESLNARGTQGHAERPLDDLLSAAGSLEGTDLANKLFGGSRSRSAGRLKADLCVQVATRLKAASVATIADLRERAADAEVRHAWTGVHGLGWVTWQYFCSLAGIDHFKPDVMLMRFIASTLGRTVGPAETNVLLSAAFDRLRDLYPELTRRTLDHTIWEFERGQLRLYFREADGSAAGDWVGEPGDWLGALQRNLWGAALWRCGERGGRGSSLPTPPACSAATRRSRL